MGTLINGRYSFRQELTGKGSSSRVLLVDDVQRGRRPCALKLLRRLEDQDLPAVRREFETLRSLRHPLIAEVYDFGRIEEIEPSSGEGIRQDPAQVGDFFITFSYVDGLDLRAAYLLLFPEALKDEASSLDPADADARWRIFYQALAEIALGLQAIHSRGLVHRDIKPHNLLLVPHGGRPVPERFEVKIIDLDLAEAETTPVGNRLRGTLPFVAPEVLSGEFVDGRSDLYSLGISIIWAISGQSPFSGLSAEEGLRAIEAGAIPHLDRLCPRSEEHTSE